MREIKDATMKLFDGLVALGMEPKEAKDYAVLSLDRALTKAREKHDGRSN